MIWDPTCGPLSAAWRAGSLLYRSLRRLDATHAAASWPDALGWLATHGGDQQIAEIQFWGHGKWGAAKIDDDPLDVEALAPGHPYAPVFARIRDRLIPDGRALWWFRTCETFGATSGHEFARAFVTKLGCRAAGHTYVIGVLQSGLHCLSPGDAPDWSPSEGLAEGTPDEPIRALDSRPGAPHTISCFTGAIPSRW
jgi:hypothetical protein